MIESYGAALIEKEKDSSKDANSRARHQIAR
jgi:hypothetical protein